MNDCQETEIIKLLYNYQNDNKVLNLPKLPLTDSNIVKIISKNMSDIIYNSYKNKSLNSKKSRVTMINLLKRWCQPNSDFLVDETNYNIFVDILTKVPSKLDTFYEKNGQEFINIPKFKEQFTSQNNWQNICQTIKNKYARNLENNIKSGLLNSWNQSQFEKNNFEFNAPNKNFQNIDIENSVECLYKLDIPLETKENNKKINEVDLFSDFFTTKPKEKIYIETCYSLLNLEKNKSNENFFIKVLKNMSESKSDDELKFIDEIWANKDKLHLSSKILIEILELFPQIYEKIVINMGKQILLNFTNFSVDYDYEDIIKRSEIENVFNICFSNPKLLLNVISVFNKLLQFSKFDVRFMKLLNIIRKKYYNN